jgi:ADP-heptose:LPS heptosyltransferase
MRSRLRELLEGVLFMLLLPVVIRAARRLAPCRPLAWARVRRRWRRRLTRGLRDYRVTWWDSSQLEPAITTWRQLLLIEAAELAGDPVGPRDGTLVALPGHLGDALHALPLLHAWRSRHPGQKLSVAVPPWSREIVEREAVADEVLTWRPPLWQYHRGQAAHRLNLLGCTAEAGALRARNFDTVITVNPTDPAVWLLVRQLRPRRWLGVGPVPGEDYPPLAEQHLVPFARGVYEGSRIQSVAGLGEGEVPALAWLPAADARTAAAIRLREAGVEEGTPVVALAPGAGWPGKQWPVTRFAEVARALAETHGCRIVLLGSPGERALAGEVAAAVGPRALNLAGQTTLLESCGLIGCASLFLGNDSALLHFAAVQRVPAVALFGPTDPAQWAPRHAGVQVLRATTGCPRCRPWHARARCDEQPACMARIPAPDVLQACVTALEAAA